MEPVITFKAAKAKRSNDPVATQVGCWRAFRVSLPYNPEKRGKKLIAAASPSINHSLASITSIYDGLTCVK